MIKLTFNNNSLNDTLEITGKKEDFFALVFAIHELGEECNKEIIINNLINILLSSDDVIVAQSLQHPHSINLKVEGKIFKDTVLNKIFIDMDFKDWRYLISEFLLASFQPCEIIVEEALIDNLKISIISS